MAASRLPDDRLMENKMHKPIPLLAEHLEEVCQEIMVDLGHIAARFQHPIDQALHKICRMDEYHVGDDMHAVAMAKHMHRKITENLINPDPEIRDLMQRTVCDIARKTEVEMSPFHYKILMHYRLDILPILFLVMIKVHHHLQKLAVMSRYITINDINDDDKNSYMIIYHEPKANRLEIEKYSETLKITGHSLIIQELPETIVTAALGRPIESLIDYYLTNGLGSKIIDGLVAEDQTIILLQEEKPVPLIELIEQST
jgi:hypothetical protein